MEVHSWPGKRGPRLLSPGQRLVSNRADHVPGCYWPAWRKVVLLPSILYNELEGEVHEPIWQVAGITAHIGQIHPMFAGG